MKKLVYGQGINDSNTPTKIAKQGKVLWSCPIYYRWKAMLGRCYSKVQQSRGSSTYDDCTVCEEWKTFSNFKDWLIARPYEEKTLDKDFLVKGNKEYSPDKCVLISNALNVLLNTHGKTRGKFPLGVHYCNKRNTFVAQCSVGEVTSTNKRKQTNLGLYEDPIEAHKVWQSAKIAYMKTFLTTKEVLEDDRLYASLLLRINNVQHDLDNGLVTESL